MASNTACAIPWANSSDAVFLKLHRQKKNAIPRLVVPSLLLR